MKCPKCGSEKVICESHLRPFQRDRDLHLQCQQCGTTFTMWQQERIAELEQKLAAAEECLREIIEKDKTVDDLIEAGDQLGIFAARALCHACPILSYPVTVF